MWWMSLSLALPLSNMLMLTPHLDDMDMGGCTKSPESELLAVRVTLGPCCLSPGSGTINRGGMMPFGNTLLRTDGLGVAVTIGGKSGMS